MTVERTTHGRPTDTEVGVDPVPPGEAEDAWAVAAREILTAAAGTYHALVDRTDHQASAQIPGRPLVIVPSATSACRARRAA